MLSTSKECNLAASKSDIQKQLTVDYPDQYDRVLMWPYNSRDSFDVSRSSNFASGASASKSPRPEFFPGFSAQLLGCKCVKIWKGIAGVGLTLMLNRLVFLFWGRMLAKMSATQFNEGYSCLQHGMGQQLKYVWGNLPNLALGTFGSKKTDKLRYLKLFKHVVFTWMADIAKLVQCGHHHHQKRGSCRNAKNKMTKMTQDPWTILD